MASEGCARSRSSRCVGPGIQAYPPEIRKGHPVCIASLLRHSLAVSASFDTLPWAYRFWQSDLSHSREEWRLFCIRATSQTFGRTSIHFPSIGRQVFDEQWDLNNTRITGLRKYLR